MTNPQGPEAPGRRRRKLSAIMMADVSGFSRMMGANEEATVDQIQEFHGRVRRLVEEFEGRVVDTAGDSVFGEFDSVVNAVQCACRIQEEGGSLHARIGIHLGDVIVEDYRVYGDGVNIAARLEPLADPGGICISEAVYHQVRNKLDLSVEDLGVKELKNVEHPIRLYRVPPIGRPAADSVAKPATATKTPAGKTADDGEPPSAFRPAILIPLSVAVFLLLSPILLFPTAGALPTLGAVLASVILGRVWAERSRRSRNLLLALGPGIASGALFTDWSRVTNAIFVLAGLVVAAAGTGGRRGKKPA